MLRIPFSNLLVMKAKTYEDHRLDGYEQGLKVGYDEGLRIGTIQQRQIAQTQISQLLDENTRLKGIA